MRLRLPSGAGIRYLTRGAGPSVVFLHPVGLRAEFWSGVMDQMAGDFRVVAMDTRGHGESERTNDKFTVHDLIDDVIGLVGAVCNPPVALVGCSMGGLLALGAAARRPDLCDALVIANSTALAPRTGPSQAAMKRAEKSRQGMGLLVEDSIDRWFSAEFQKREPEKVDQIRRWLSETDPIAHGWSWEILALRDISFDGDALPPALAVTGSLDKSAGPEAVEASARSMQNVAFHLISDVGHLTPYEAPEKFAAAMSEFVGATRFRERPAGTVEDRGH